MEYFTPSQCLPDNSVPLLHILCDLFVRDFFMLGVFNKPVLVLSLMSGVCLCVLSYSGDAHQHTIISRIGSKTVLTMSYLSSYSDGGTDFLVS